MHQNGVMVSQLVARRLLSDDPEFQAVSNQEDAHPMSFEDARLGVRVPRLGSDDLIHIARFALNEGFYVDGFVILGRHGSPIDDEQYQIISKQLIDDLTAGATYASAQFSRRNPGYFIAGIDMTTPDMHSLLVRRLGVIETDAPDIATDFLKSAWRTVRFG